MANLLLWLSWRDAQPEDSIWSALVARVAARGRFPGETGGGPGWRWFAARTRAAEPDPVVVRADELLLLDRAEGRDDPADRQAGDWSDTRLQDGTPTAALRLHLPTLTLEAHRDLMGQRALACARVPGGVIVASGEDVLRAHPAVSTDLDDDYLAAYFTGLPPPHEASVFRDIRLVPAGASVRFDAAGATTRQRRLQPDDSWRGQRDEAIVERFRELFQRSVEDACRGARRVGISLSAGLDSSSIAAVAARLPVAPGGRIVGVTQGLATYPEIDERAMVASLAAEIGIEHRPIVCDDLLPFSDPALRPVCPDTPRASPFREWKEATYREFADAGVDVWLSGVFGDLLFSGGVEWVVEALHSRRWRVLLRELWRQARSEGVGAMAQDTAVRRPVSRLLGRVQDLPQRIDWLLVQYRSAVRDRLTTELQSYRDFPRPRQCLQLLAANASLDASGECWHAHAHGMECRAPFRDEATTRLCLSLPADLFQRASERKWLLREAMRGYLSDALRTRPKSSDLTPFQIAAWDAQESSHRALRTRAESTAQRFCMPLTPTPKNATYVRQWRVAAFAAWQLRTDTACCG